MDVLKIKYRNKNQRLITTASKTHLELCLFIFKIWFQARNNRYHILTCIRNMLNTRFEGTRCRLSLSTFQSSAQFDPGRRQWYLPFTISSAKTENHDGVETKEQPVYLNELELNLEIQERDVEILGETEWRIQLQEMMFYPRSEGAYTLLETLIEAWRQFPPFQIFDVRVKPEWCYDAKQGIGFRIIELLPTISCKHRNWPLIAKYDSLCMKQKAMYTYLEEQEMESAAKKASSSSIGSVLQTPLHNSSSQTDSISYPVVTNSESLSKGT